MKTFSARLLLWTPRVAALLLAAFLGLFALDAFGEGVPLRSAIPAFLVHLVPTYVVLGVVAIAWRHQWAGALAFAALAVVYGVTVHWRLDWVAAISGPLLGVAALFLWSWMRRGDIRLTDPS